MDVLWQGIQVGLVLCIMAGPIFFTLLQVGVEEGLAAGSMVALGVWISDLLFIVGVSLSLAYLMGIAENDRFIFYLGTIGGGILMTFGLATLLSKAPRFNMEANIPSRCSSWIALFSKGFLINTINPFTVFFWIGIASTMIIKSAFTWSQALVFFIGLMGTVMISDFLKVYLARSIRAILRPVHVLWLRRISGAAIFGFGIAMIIRVFYGI